MVLRMIVMLTIGGGLAWLTCHPLPDLHGLLGIDKYDEVLVGGFGDLRVDLATGGIVGNITLGIGLTLEDLHTAFFGDSVEDIGLAVDFYGKLCRMTVPS